MRIREHHPLEPVTEAHFVIEVSMSELKALHTASATLHSHMRDAIAEAIRTATGPRKY